MNQQDESEVANGIFAELANLIYSRLTEEEGAEVSIELEFDDMQRITKIHNALPVDGLKTPTADDFAILNQAASEILKLSDIYKLKSLHIEIKDGCFGVNPTYLN